MSTTQQFFEILVKALSVAHVETWVGNFKMSICLHARSLPWRQTFFPSSLCSYHLSFVSATIRATNYYLIDEIHARVLWRILQFSQANEYGEFRFYVYYLLPAICFGFTSVSEFRSIFQSNYLQFFFLGACKAITKVIFVGFNLPSFFQIQGCSETA